MDSRKLPAPGTVGFEEGAASLTDNEDQLKFAIEAAELGTWNYNPLTHCFTANDRLKAWFGLEPKGEIALALAIDIMIEEDRPRVTAAIQRAIQYDSGGYYDIKYTILHPVTRIPRIVRAKGRASFNESKIAYRFNGIMQDITEQEMARQKNEQAEEKALLAIASADLGTYEINLQTDDMITSDRFNAIWGMRHSFPRSKIVEFIHPGDRAIREQAHRDSIATGKLHYEARLIWEDGSAHWVRVKGKVLYNDEGQATTLIGVIQDITEQKLFAEEMTKQVKERTLELQRSNDDLLQFAHVISHDLKEPVRKVKLFGGRLRDEMSNELPEKAQTYLGKIQNAADRMFSMIDGVLSYSALNSSEQLIEPVPLGETISHVQADLELVIHQKKARFIVGELPVIEGASVLLYQLFYNLINNALKFSNPEATTEISISSVLSADSASIIISDNGIGFDQAYADRIFGTFARLHPKDKYEGTGLGLALCKKIAERHEGSITAAGTTLQGAIFTVTLPLKQSTKHI